MAAQVPFEVRTYVVNAYKNGRTQAEIAEIFGISQASVSRLLKKLDEDGHLHPAKRKGLTPKLNDAELQVVKKIVENKNDLTLMEIAERIEERLGKIVSEPTVHRMLKKLGFRRKKKTRQAAERYRPEVKKKEMATSTRLKKN